MYAKILPGLELERKIWARKGWGNDWWQLSMTRPDFWGGGTKLLGLPGGVDLPGGQGGAGGHHFLVASLGEPSTVR